MPRKIRSISLTILLFSGILLSCNYQPGTGAAESKEPTTTEAHKDYKSLLTQARAKYKTKLVKFNQIKEKPETPPGDLFSIVSFPTNIGNMGAYLGKIPNDSKLHPAMIWLTGGFGNTMDNVWKEEGAEDDQTAAVFRKAGLVMMYPAQRGGHMSPGNEECFYGEVDDIIAARDFLARQKGVDSNRIYLGGHSTGGTKALLVAESTNQFKAVFCFGPVSSALKYGAENLTYDVNVKTENLLRAPGAWLSQIATPTYILEGNEGMSNISELHLLKELADKNGVKQLYFYEINGKDHFNGLQPASKIIATKIMEDNLNFENKLFKYVP